MRPSLKKRGAKNSTALRKLPTSRAQVLSPNFNPADYYEQGKMLYYVQPHPGPLHKQAAERGRGSLKPSEALQGWGTEGKSGTWQGPSRGIPQSVTEQDTIGPSQDRHPPPPMYSACLLFVEKL